MDDSELRPPSIIVVKKKKGGHGGHHGGAWKVAYADFVTAMMALFMVLWLLNSSQEVQQAVGGYFQDPLGDGKLVGSQMSGAGGGDAIGLKEDDMEKLKEKLEQAMKEIPQFQKIKDQVQLIVTGEGLRVELLETDAGTFFESGSPGPTDKAMELLAKLATEIGKLPNKLLIEGHTDAKPFSGDYSNWELSADRANTARRIMQEHGVRSDQVAQVRGYADQKLRKSAAPDDPSNRRISVIIQYLERPPGAAPGAKPAKGKQGAASGHGAPAAAASGHEPAKAEEHNAPAKTGH
jgi:chemotaxis protein MotB